MEKGEILVGTIDSWLIWNMTEGGRHVTDATNASRTMLFNIQTLAWDDYLLDGLGIPRGTLPEVLRSADDFGESNADFLGCSVPITGVMGDQQAALLGHGCTEPGMIKNTYGTGCFLLANTGRQACFSRYGLLTTVAWSLEEGPCYALEGSVFTVGSVVQWLIQTGLIGLAAESGPLAMSVADTNGVMFVPAFSGLGSPYWDAQTRGMLMGLTSGSGRAHIVRAALEAIAYQNAVLLESVAADAGFQPRVMLVDGGVAQNDFLMGFQADILTIRVERPPSPEVTARGAAYAAALGSGFLRSVDEVPSLQTPRVFEPAMEEGQRKHLLEKWRNAVACARSWK
jgi:glycerol kinase